MLREQRLRLSSWLRTTSRYRQLSRFAQTNWLTFRSSASVDVGVVLKELNLCSIFTSRQIVVLNENVKKVYALRTPCGL